MTDIRIEIGTRIFSGTITDERFLDELPVVGVTRRYGDEVYFIVKIDVSYDSDQAVFAPGDIVFWRSGSTWKAAVALFFGNTPIGAGDKPRTPSGALKIGHFNFDGEALEEIKTGDIGRIIVG
jgi:hypothetical protein